MTPRVVAMFQVTIDKHDHGYLFDVQPASLTAMAMVALDSTPRIMAVVGAADPGEAAAHAWEMASKMHEAKPAQLEQFFSLLQGEPDGS